MIDFVHGLVISLLSGGRALLEAELARFEINDVPIPWIIYRGSSPAEQMAWSPKFGAFRAALAAFGFYYLGGEPYGGLRAGRLRHQDRLFFYTAYMSNNNYEMAGFWLRMYVKPLSDG
jgi:hypothetical protein